MRFAIGHVDAPGGSVKRIHLPNRSCRSHPWVGNIPWGKEWQPIPVLLPGESHGQRSLVGLQSNMTQ